MADEWLTNKTQLATPEAGLLVINGTLFAGLSANLLAGAQETAGVGYGRHIEVGSPAAASGGVTHWSWQANALEKLSGAWSVDLATGLAGVNSARTSFAAVWGSDGRPYVCALGALGPTTVRALTYDVLAGTWAATTPTVRGPAAVTTQFTTAAGIRGRLYAGVDNGAWAYNPVKDEVVSIRSSGGGTFAGRHGKVVEHSGRIFFFGELSQDLFCWEIYGEVMVQIGSLGGVNMAVGDGADFAVLPAPGVIAVLFNSSEGATGAGDRMVTVAPGTGGQLSGATITDVTNPTISGIPVQNPPLDSMLEPFPTLVAPGNNDRVFCCAVDMRNLDVTAGPGQAGSGGYSFWEDKQTEIDGGSGQTQGGLWRWNGASGVMLQEPGGIRPDRSKVSEWEGGMVTKFVGVLPLGQPSMHVESVATYNDGSITDGLQIFFRAMTALGGIGTVTVKLYGIKETPGSQIGPQPVFELALAGPVTGGGTLDLVNNKITGAPSGASGSGAGSAPLNSFVWDRAADGYPLLTQPRLTLAQVP